MKKLFVSDYVGFDESATKAALYSFDSKKSVESFSNCHMTSDARSSMFLTRAVTMAFPPVRPTTHMSSLLLAGFLLYMILLP